MDFTPADHIRAFRRGVFVGMIEEHDARYLISKQEAWIDRDGPMGRRLILRSDNAESRVRSLSGRDACGGTVSPTYVEELYSGSKKDATAIVTGRCYSLKKMASRGAQMVPYKESEGFARKRFNPDRLPVGLIPARRNDAIAASWQ